MKTSAPLSVVRLAPQVFVFVIALLVVSILLNLIGGALEGISEAYFNAAREEISSSNPRAILSSPAAMKGLDYSLNAKTVYLVDRIITLIAGITILVQCFKVRGMLRDHYIEQSEFSTNFSGLLTFFFSVYYLQYKINRLSDDNVKYPEPILA